MKNEKGTIVLAGGVIGLIAAILVFFGNPANMGFCIACFLRDTTGALGLHSAAAVQYIRPEIIGLVLGACIISLAKKEFRPRGGSAPVTRFTLGAFVMIGCLHSDNQASSFLMEFTAAITATTTIPIITAIFPFAVGPSPEDASPKLWAKAAPAIRPRTVTAESVFPSPARIS